MINLYNSLTKSKETLVPISSLVRMYVCGPTVYDYAHIGNARPLIVFDVLARLLRYEYGNDHVKYTRNLTDIDDKIMNRATECGITIRELTEETIKNFHEDVAALGCAPPDVEPKATDHIKEMISVIEKIITNGHAYEAEGHVLFSVPSLPFQSPFHHGVETVEARIEPASYKKNVADFVLWKPSTGLETGWESPWGYGRPGWHIECSAMAWRHLGETFDIHGGGIDLMFPHHENEISQSRCAFGHSKMASIFMHNGFLTVENEKMGKSLGNMITIRDLLKDWPGETLRFNMLRTHYRHPIDWTIRSLEESDKIIKNWRKADQTVAPIMSQGFIEALSDDLNTPWAITHMHSMHDGELLAAAALLGIDISPKKIVVENLEEIELLVAARDMARANKEWKVADLIRDKLKIRGISLMDSPDGTKWELK
jgi:cysteinyl-tRNA synthetase